MSEEHLSIIEAAQFLGVSVQTLRNWDGNNYLKAEKTRGGHRRYTKERLEAFLRETGSTLNNSITWESRQDMARYEAALEAAEEECKLPEAGGFTSAEMSLLCKNQQSVVDQHTKEFCTRDMLAKIAGNFIAPYLFSTQVMTGPTDIIHYWRPRNNRLVCESECVYAMTHKVVVTSWNDGTGGLLHLVEDSDRMVIEDALVNAGTVTEVQESSLLKAIEEALESLKYKVGQEDTLFVLCPPELLQVSGSDAEKLNKNLKRATNRSFAFGDGVETYISRLIDDNKVLMGVKSKLGVTGMAFCPYMLACKNGNSSEYMMRIGKKLLRDGARYYYSITVV